MKTIILGGFLGSGKTTVLLQYAAYLIRRSGGRENPVVILENEISEAGVDNQLLSQAGFEVKNIFSGCICCTSTGQLKDSVRKIMRDYDPEWLLIEATGMAYPDSIRAALSEDEDMSAGILALVDAKRWNRVKRAMPDFVTSQLKDADEVLINKTDLVDEETLRQVESDVKTYSAKARVDKISALREQPDALWSGITEVLSREQQ